MISRSLLVATACATSARISENTLLRFVTNIYDHHSLHRGNFMEKLNYSGVVYDPSLEQNIDTDNVAPRALREFERSVDVAWSDVMFDLYMFSFNTSLNIDLDAGEESPEMPEAPEWQPMLVPKE